MPAMTLQSISTHYATKPPRIVIYGDHGIGKTTFGASAPSPIFLRTEDGLAAIQVPTFPIAQTFRDVIAAISTLYTERHPFQTLTVDTLDWLEPLVWAHTCEMGGDKANIEAFGYGKGYKLADEHWHTFLDGLDALRNNGMTVICLAHAIIKRFDAPDTEAYDRYQLKLHERAANLIKEWADVIGFAHNEVHTVTQDQGFNNKTTRGVSVGRRILSVEERAAYEAKNRYSLPADLDFPRVGAWDVFANACAPAFSAPAPTQINYAPPAPPPIAAVEKRINNEPAIVDDTRALDELEEHDFGDRILEHERGFGGEAVVGQV